jgi:hypothetical protein
MYELQREIRPTTYTKIRIELPMPLYYKIIKPQNIVMTRIAVQSRHIEQIVQLFSQENQTKVAKTYILCC